MPFRVVMVAMEMAPLIKVGGLADVVGALSRVLAERGHDVTVILPGLQALGREPWGLEIVPHPVLEFPYGDGVWRQRVGRLHRSPPGVRIFVLEDAAFASHPGVYVDPATGLEYPDSADRYARFGRGAVELLLRLDLTPDVLHLHDFQTALIPSFLKRARVGERYLQGARTVLTIHNLGHQGVYDPLVLTRAGMTHGFYAGGPLEFWGKTNYLKTGILDADLVTTVSTRYAAEILESPEFGHGLEGVLRSRARDLVGILNGIDTEVWNPARDPHLAAPYDGHDLSGKRRNQEALRARCGLTEGTPARPLAGMVTRLAEQKGIDLVAAGAERLLALGLDLAVLGSGRKDYESFFHALARAHPDRVYYQSAFDDPLAHLIEAGADCFLMPSRYEPCGLNQLISLRYGTVPVVRKVGGLADTVIPMEEDATRGTGFVFQPYTVDAFVAAVERAVRLFADRERWTELIRRGMARDVSWEGAAPAYERAYERVLRAPARPPA